MINNDKAHHSTIMINCTLTMKTQHNQKVPLLKLPAELRNEIYCYVFDGHVISVPQYRIGDIRMLVYRKEIYLSERASPILQLFALTETCRQVYHDTYLLPFEMLEFRLEVDHDIVFKAARTFLDGLSDKRRAAIATVHLPATLYIDHLNTSHELTGTDNDAQTESWKESKNDKRLRTLLGQLGGLKSILILDEVYSGNLTAEQEEEMSLKVTQESCECVVKWMKLLLDDRDIDVWVDVNPRIVSY